MWSKECANRRNAWPVCVGLLSPSPLPAVFVPSTAISSGIFRHSAQQLGPEGEERAGDPQRRQEIINQLEGGKSWKTSWRCGLPSWGLKAEEKLSREREGADLQAERRTGAGALILET